MYMTGERPWSINTPPHPNLINVTFPILLIKATIGQFFDKQFPHCLFMIIAAIVLFRHQHPK
jgi:hypothetical protein